MRTALKVVVVALIAALLAACGGSPATTPPAQPTTDTVAATTVPTALVLSETYTSENGRWTFQYPAGWIATMPMSNIFRIATSQATGDKAFTADAFRAGEVSVGFSLTPIDDLNSDPAMHVTNFTSRILISVGEAAETTVNGRNGARVDGSNDVRHMMVISQVFGDMYINATTYTNPGEFAQMEPTLLAIIESVNYSAE